MRFFLFLILAAVSACAPSSWEDCRYEAEAETRKFALELKSVRTKEDLQKSLPKIKNRFNRIGDLLVKICDLQKKGKASEGLSEPSAASQDLFKELLRIYEIPGAREIIESCQTEAVRKFDKAKNGVR